jgi:TorA maturation chaperone TorD
MRDPGLDQAITAAGGVGALARKIGIAQPSISNWSRVPAERVLTVEAVTGVSREVLRPDLYSDRPGIDEVDAARAREYALLATLLARAPDQALLDRIAGLHGDASPLGLAHVALAEAARQTNVERAEREYFDLFIGLGRGELLPYGSYYLTGFLHERPLARLRESLAQLGIERAAGQAEPEDHAAILCEIMAGLASGRFPVPEGPSRVLFEEHLAPWMGAGRDCGVLPPNRNGRAGVDGNRTGSVRTAVVSDGVRSGARDKRVDHGQGTRAQARST